MGNSLHRKNSPDASAKSQSGWPCAAGRISRGPCSAGRNIRYQVADRTARPAAAGSGPSISWLLRPRRPDPGDRRAREAAQAAPAVSAESDHVLSLAYNVLAGGTCIEAPGDAAYAATRAYLDALARKRRTSTPPPPATSAAASENEQQVLTLMETINQTRLTVWRQQEGEFFDRAVLDADGTIAPTFGACKAGMNISYDGQWGYHPLLISLANTKEPLYLVNRSGNRPSHERADEYLDKAITLCRRAGFKSILLRGDTDFMQSWKLVLDEVGRRRRRHLHLSGPTPSSR